MDQTFSEDIPPSTGKICPEIQPALDAIGFVEDLTPVTTPIGAGLEVLAYPNPAADALTVEFVLEKSQPVELDLINAQGQVTREFSNANSEVAGMFSQLLDLKGLPSGLYFLRVKLGFQYSLVKFLKE